MSKITKSQLKNLIKECIKEVISSKFKDSELKKRIISDLDGIKNVYDVNDKEFKIEFIDDIDDTDFKYIERSIKGYSRYSGPGGSFTTVVVTRDLNSKNIITIYVDSGLDV
jgi:DNA-dependent RNA polymerase auxiliary subunit epsilon